MLLSMTYSSPHEHVVVDKLAIYMNSCCSWKKYLLQLLLSSLIQMLLTRKLWSKRCQCTRRIVAGGNNCCMFFTWYANTNATHQEVVVDKVLMYMKKCWSGKNSCCMWKKLVAGVKGDKSGGLYIKNNKEISLRIN